MIAAHAKRVAVIAAAGLLISAQARAQVPPASGAPAHQGTPQPPPGYGTPPPAYGTPRPPPAYGTPPPPAYGAPQPPPAYGAPQPPPAYGAPQPGNGAPPAAYGAPPAAYGGRPGNGAPPGYGTAAGYGAPPGYGAGPGYGPPPPGYDSPPPGQQNGAPEAHVGFQLALRTGYALPMGRIDSGSPNSSQSRDMSDYLGGQVPFVVDIGGKVIPALFVGGYLGFGIGGVTGQEKVICDKLNASCSVVTVRTGVELQYHILPDGLSDPWIGYGIGFESTSISISSSGQDASGTLSGFELAHLMAGVDFRVSRVFGIGPFLDFSVGSYSHMSVSGTGISDTSQSIDNTASHQWLALGARGVFFP